MQYVFLFYSADRAQQLMARISIVQVDVENLKCKEARQQVSGCKTFQSLLGQAASG